MGFVRALRVAYVLAWGLPLGRRPGLLTDGVLVSLAITGQLVASGTGAWLRSTTAVGGLVAAIAVPLIGAGIWWWVAWRLPHADAPLRALLPGNPPHLRGPRGDARPDGVLLRREARHAPRLYGSLGIAATILAWLYVVARLIVAGGFLNATLWYRRHPRETAAPPG